MRKSYKTTFLMTKEELDLIIHNTNLVKIHVVVEKNKMELLDAFQMIKQCYMDKLVCVLLADDKEIYLYRQTFTFFF